MGNFEGIYVFNGNNAATFSDNPAIAGTYLGYYWSQLEPVKGQYAWDLIDNDMKPWTTTGKRVILRVSTAGQSKWQPPNSGHGTPQWVYDLGVESVTETDNSVLPQYWNPLFIQHFGDFITALAARYDGNPHISVVEIGVGVGGETKPDTMNNGKARMSQWKNIGYSDKTWLETIQNIAGLYIAAFHSTPLALMPNASFIGGTKGYSEQLVLDYAVAQKLGLQNNGLVKGQTLPVEWSKVPFVIAEQRNDTKTSGDTLAGDLALALQQKAMIAMIFASDITPANQPVLAQYAAMATPPVVSTGNGGSTGSTGGSTGGTGTGTGGVVCPCPCCPMKNSA